MKFHLKTILIHAISQLVIWYETNRVSESVENVAISFDVPSEFLQLFVAVTVFIIVQVGLMGRK
jgi:hypothetical protein